MILRMPLRKVNYQRLVPKYAQYLSCFTYLTDGMDFLEFVDPVARISPYGRDTI